MFDRCLGRNHDGSATICSNGNAPAQSEVSIIRRASLAAKEKPYRCKGGEKIIRAGEEAVVEYNKAGEEEAMECVTVGGAWGAICYRARQNEDGVTAVAEE